MAFGGMQDIVGVVCVGGGGQEPDGGRGGEART